MQREHMMYRDVSGSHNQIYGLTVRFDEALVCYVGDSLAF